VLKLLLDSQRVSVRCSSLTLWFTDPKPFPCPHYCVTLEQPIPFMYTHQHLQLVCTESFIPFISSGFPHPVFCFIVMVSSSAASICNVTLNRYRKLVVSYRVEKTHVAPSSTVWPSSNKSPLRVCSFPAHSIWVLWQINLNSDRFFRLFIFLVFCVSIIPPMLHTHSVISYQPYTLYI